MDHKLVLVALCAVWLCEGMASALFTTVDGGAGSLILVPDKPFYDVYGFCSSNLFLNITYPVDNQTFYFPTITPLVNYTISGASNPICRTATAGNWTLRPCVNGLNWYLETLPAGYDLPLSVNVQDDCGSNVTQSITLNVIYHRGANIGEDDFWIVWCFVLVAFGVMAYGILLEEGYVRGG